jgi:glycosyltransferase involved in cell wall biosynthesis
MFDAMSFSILPSVMEACPLVALESMARGKTLVASRVGGLSEIVVHRETGLLVDQSAEELAEGMCYMLSNHNERDRMATNGRVLVNERFSNENMLERLERIYYRAAGVV